jgi:hypothetical protein
MGCKQTIETTETAEAIGRVLANAILDKIE